MGFQLSEEAIDTFFAKRESTSKIECDEVARNIVGKGCIAQAAGTQGSSSYTVECSTKSVLSFRQRGSTLDSRVTNLAKDIHGRLIPDVSYCGNVGEGADGLIVYRMSYLPGTPMQQLYPQVADSKLEDKRNISTFYKDLAGYFARSWWKPLSEAANWNAIRRLGLLKSSKLFTSVDALVARIEHSLSALFGQTGEWPKVLTNGDFSDRHILLDSNTFAITGIVGWTKATIGVFGLDLAILNTLRTFRGEGDSITEYACWREMEDLFWDEFWSLAGIVEDKWVSTRYLAETAADLAILFCYGFQSMPSGRMKDDLAKENGHMLEVKFGLKSKILQIGLGIGNLKLV
ncbi:F-box domain-containing protein [Apiospora saccharicola]|uniref:F-box domain-containing protein n=1 Tax=Apiospora saccharicola TaxID=335842 RepID=A0ABR1W3H5_9PEZI